MGGVLREFHSCGACNCHVPVDVAYDALHAKYKQLLAEFTRLKLEQAKRYRERRSH